MAERKGAVSTSQLLVPEILRQVVLDVAHESILGGHMGNKKTLDRISVSFYGQVCALMCGDTVDHVT
jgi:hypothetical protein